MLNLFQADLLITIFCCLSENILNSSSILSDSFTRYINFVNSHSLTFWVYTLMPSDLYNF
jgi:hypothetical protein